MAGVPDRAAAAEPPRPKVPENARSPQVNLRRQSMSHGSAGIAIPANAHGVLRGQRLSDLLGLMAWWRRSDRIIALTTEAVNGDAVRRLSDLAILRCRAARAGSDAFRSICIRIAQEIGGTAPASVTRFLDQVPARSAFDAKPGINPRSERRIILRPLQGRGDPDGLATTCTLRGMLTPEAAADGWAVFVPTLEDLLTLLPPAWIPALDQSILQELARNSAVYGQYDSLTILRSDVQVRREACALAWRMAEDTSTTFGVRVPDALQALGLEQGGGARSPDEAAFLNRLEQVLGGQFAFEPWRTPTSTLVIDGGAVSLDRLALLWEDIYAGVAENRGTANRTLLLVDGRLLTQPRFWTLAEDGLRRGRKFSLGIVVACPSDTPAAVAEQVRVFSGFSLQIRDDRRMIMDTDVSQPEEIGDLPMEDVRLGLGCLLNGENFA